MTTPNPAGAGSGEVVAAAIPEPPPAPPARGPAASRAWAIGYFAASPRAPAS
ncbi:hypothetical protein I552_2603 [Mycobacterium xenopi 3993]|nr:hypothetical protein I552_2603 [Mycobacterium xenopi 3993]